MAKGADWERQCARTFSQWWANGLGLGDRSDIFWRSSQSGGRATIRSRKGLRTYGSYGDLTALDPVGEPLLKVFTLELKRGYSADHLHMLLDKLPNAALQTYEKWMTKAASDAQAAGSASWLLIARRNRCLPLAVLPYWTATALFAPQAMPAPHATFMVKVDGTAETLLVCPLQTLLGAIQPKDILAYLEARKRA